MEPTGFAILFEAVPHIPRIRAPLRRISRSEVEHDPFLGLAITDLTQRLSEPLQRTDGRNRRIYQVFFEQAKYLLEAFPHPLWHSLAIIADLQPTDLNIFDQQVVHLERGDLTG